MSMSPARSPGWGSPKSMNETNDDFSDDSFFEQAAQQIIEQQRIATQKANDGEYFVIFFKFIENFKIIWKIFMFLFR